MHVIALSFFLLSSPPNPTQNAEAMAAANNVGSYKTVTGEKQLLHKLYGHVSPLTQNSEQRSRVDGQKDMTLSFALPFNNASELEALLQAQQDPASPSYHKYLTSEEFAQRFHPTAAQVAQTEAFLRAHGLTPAGNQGLFVKATGRVADVEALLHTELFNYEAPDGSAFFAPAYELQIPAGSAISAVLGLSNAAKPHHHAINMGPARAHAAQGPQSFSAAGVRQAYSVPASATGAGQVLALLELDGYDPSDISGYAQANNLPQANLTNIVLDGYDGTLGGGAGEVTLDIELMMALAPNAKQIQVFEAPNTGTAMSDIWNEMANPTQGEPMPKIISCSWGISETFLTKADVQADYNIFKQMAAQGQTVYSAAGDSGAYDNGYSLSVDEPAAQPYVVGVGGTALYVDGQGNYSRESTWATGGGGISRFWAVPSWQVGVLGAGSQGSIRHRNVPDVSLNADPNTGYNIYFQGQWVVFGGTSCAAPLWAAFQADVEQSRVNAHLQPLGFLTPTLYKLLGNGNQSKYMHDIADGSRNGWYPAVKGFDDATGWGTFQGGVLLNALSK